MQIIILAAGKGSRMNSEKPKVMHEIAGRPMLEHVVHNCSQVTDDLVLVYSDHLLPYLGQFDNRCKTVRQAEPLGTAHAVWTAKDYFKKEEPIGVIYGDNPLITSKIITDLFGYLQESNSKIVTLAFDYTKPNHYGRIILDEEGNFLKIVESKFATEQELKISLCNSGIMAFAPGILEKYIDVCITPDKSNSDKELYLTEIIQICAAAREKVSYFKSLQHQLVVGVNTQKELSDANLLYTKNRL